jgi:CubicO group peptidase (beta-lactamase class C family)/predicted aspartyl protease
MSPTVRLAALLAASATSVAAIQEAARPRAKTDAEIVAALGARLKELGAAGEFSGAVLLAKGEQLLVRDAVGLASRETGAPNTPGTRFNLGSINKAFTRLAIEQLAAGGKLTLADTLDRYVPEFPAESARRITIAQLLEHRGGTGDFFGPKYDACDRGRLRNLRDWLPLFVDAPLEFEPGARQRYSNAGYLLLGLVIERVSGRSYYDYVRDRIFKPAAMADTESYPVDAAVANRATGYTREGGQLSDNRPFLPWRGTSAGGGYSTVDDLRRFADALRAGKLGGGAGGGLGVAGGAPGVNAVLEMAGGYTLVVMANLDPPAAQRVASEVREWLGGADGAGPRRRVIRTSDTGGPADTIEAPRTTVVAADGADVPMLRSGHMPAVHVMLNGQGPFLFAIDTGGAGTARVDTGLAERLGLEKVGEVLGGDPSGRNARTMVLVAIDSLQVGAARFEGLRAAVRDMREMPPGEKADGILGFGLFAGCLLTLDYPASTVRMARGELPPANGRDVLGFTRERGVPTARITVAGREMDADVDSGFMGGVSLPEAEAGRLPLSMPPKVVGRGRTLGNTFEIKAAPLDGDVGIGAILIERPTVEFQPVFPTAGIGARVLGDLAITFDQKNNRMRVAKPAR